MIKTPVMAAVLASFLAMMSVGAAEGDSPASSGPDGEAEWAAGFESALEQAQVEGRLVMIDFYTDWCGWCKKLDHETYRDPQVVERLRRMVTVKVDAESRTDLAQRYGVRSYPTIVFTDGAGSPVNRVRGYLSADRFAPVLDQLMDASGSEFTLRQRLKDHPEQLGLRLDLARLLVRGGRYRDAIGQIDTLSALTPKPEPDQESALRLERGRAFIGESRWKDARKEFERLGKMAPDEQTKVLAIFYMAEARRLEGKAKDARKLYRKLLEVRTSGWLAETSRRRLEDLG